jgi:acetolactate synthase-1/2/3 large subunit
MNIMENEYYSTADAMLEALQETGISYLFSNLGSDHPALIEGLAKAKAQNKTLPEVVICPHEYVALSAAQGYYLLSGEAQGVFVHTDVGTQNLGGSLHNVNRSRVPVFIFSGETPSTMHGELPGSRNIPVNYIQNVYDQRGIVREYVKWEYDIRHGNNVKELIYRAMQLANSDPKGPVYLTGTREVLAGEVNPCPNSSRKWRPIEKGVLSASDVQKIVKTLIEAKKPLIITSYLGRDAESVEQLISFCEKLAIPVVESFPSYMNFPADHPLHMGFQVDLILPNADVVLVIDSDMPWLPIRTKLHDDCKVFYMDIDPVKENIPLWNIPAEGFYQVDSYQSLLSMNEYLNQFELEENVYKERLIHWEKQHVAQRLKWQESEKLPDKRAEITAEWLTACLRNIVDDDTIILNETITNAAAVLQHLPRNKPGTMFANGGTSLGWSGGGAFGAKLAKPDKTVVNLIGDGSYHFSIPSTVYWMSRRYNAPILTVIYNNQGWNATKNNFLTQYPEGYAKRDDRFWVNFDQPADLAKMAEAAGGAYAVTVSDPELLPASLQDCMNMVKSGRSAVIDVRLTKISNQKD